MTKRNVVSVAEVTHHLVETPWKSVDVRILVVATGTCNEKPFEAIADLHHDNTIPFSTSEYQSIRRKLKTAEPSRSPYEEDYGDGLKTYYKTLERIAAVEEIAWSSRLSPEDNEKHANSLKEKWKDSETAKSHFIHLLDKALPVNTAGVEA